MSVHMLFSDGKYKLAACSLLKCVGFFRRDGFIKFPKQNNMFSDNFARLVDQRGRDISWEASAELKAL